MPSYRKLVRDKIPAILDKKGIPYEMVVAEEDEYRTELIKKLMEEVQEFSGDLSVDELADVIEVINALKVLPEYVEVEKVRMRKKLERGGFKKKIILKGESA